MKLQITIDGKAYEVDVEVLEDDESQQTPGYSPSPAAHAGGGHAQAGTTTRAACGMRR